MCDRQRFKNEFQLKNFLLVYEELHRFVQFEWGWPKLYCAWRAFWAVYHLTWIIVSGFMSWQWTTTVANEIKWFIYITNWSYFMLTMTAILDFLAVVYIQVARIDIVQGQTKDITWYQKTVWVFFNVSNCGGVLITILYWAMIYTGGNSITAVNVATHALNSVYIIMNLIVAATPVRLYHMTHTVIYSATFVLFSVIYQKAGGTNGIDKPYIYSMIDWNADPSTAVMYSCVLTLVGVPVIHLSIFLLFMLRVAVFSRPRVSSETGINLKEIDKA